MNNTREQILNILLVKHRATINDLAEEVGIHPISVRHHISKLETLGQITSEEIKGRVGRPKREYFLTQSGMEEFPTRYLTLSIRLLEQLKGVLPEKTVAKLFREIAADMVHDHTAQVNLSRLDFEERLNLITKLLESEGFTIEITPNEKGYEIKGVSCPYKHVGQEHPEICMVDQAIIEKVLSTHVEKTHCVLSGDKFCAYQTPLPPITEIKLSEEEEINAR
ncbi:MAG: winged helix-turn-helix transcriptional regulator [Anaerolineales bacterium]|nr:winged helix-turn-helix transcriptional regulator [Anaerolineales bacterium]